MIISFFIDRLQYTTRFTLRNSFEVVLIHGSIIQQLERFIENLQKQEFISIFDKRLWCSLVDFITVNEKDDIWVTFKDGTEIKA